MRKPEGRFVSWISDIYNFSSNYGESPERASLLLLVLIAFNFFMILSNQLAVLTVDCANEAVRRVWLDALCAGDFVAELLKSGVLTFRPFINPLGVLSLAGCGNSRVVGLIW